MLKAVTVIYPKGSLRSGADGGSELNPYRTKDRRMPISIFVKPEDQKLDICEIVWEWMNVYDDDNPKNIQLLNYKERSMMVGDIVEFDNQRYRCASMGFVLIS